MHLKIIMYTLTGSKIYGPQEMFLNFSLQNSALYMV